MAESRSRSSNRLEDALRALAEEFVRRIAETIHTEIAREFQDKFQSFTQQISSMKDLSLSRPYRVCPVPECGKPGAGPRYGWFCREHFLLPESEKSQYRKAPRAARNTRAPVKKRSTRGKSVDTSQVKKLKAQGLSLSQIAHQLGISKTSVVRHLKK